MILLKLEKYNMNNDTMKIISNITEEVRKDKFKNIQDNIINNLKLLYKMIIEFESHIYYDNVYKKTLNILRFKDYISNLEDYLRKFYNNSNVLFIELYEIKDNMEDIDKYYIFIKIKENDFSEFNLNNVSRVELFKVNKNLIYNVCMLDINSYYNCLKCPGFKELQLDKFTDKDIKNLSNMIKYIIGKEATNKSLYLRYQFYYMNDNEKIPGDINSRTIHLHIRKDKSYRYDLV
jgi:hypothetical protein